MTITLGEETVFWERVATDTEIAAMLKASVRNSARGLSEMVGRPITIETPRVEAVPIGQVPTVVGNPETEMVGIYLLIEGDLTGQVILMLPVYEALHLVDLLLGVPAGTTTGLGDLERSALAETGNLTASFFLNEVASITGALLRPSPPAVMIDMLGAIIGVVTTPVAALSDSLVVVETAFQEPGRIVLAHFWVLPYPQIVP